MNNIVNYIIYRRIKPAFTGYEYFITFIDNTGQKWELLGMEYQSSPSGTRGVHIFIYIYLQLYMNVISHINLLFNRLITAN